MTDFSNITPCGGNCIKCEFFQNRKCKGCNINDGKCVKLWENGCKIYECCQKHDEAFCGLCKQFPCEYLKQTMTWDKDGINNLYKLKKEYQNRNTEFSLYLPSLWKKIGSHGVMTLSTSSVNRVTSRPMSMVTIEGKFYCQTDKAYLKYRQIIDNPNAVVCHKNFSIEGTCRCIGRPLDSKNDFFVNTFKKYFYGSYKAYSALRNERLLEIIPVLIYSWNYKLTKPYMEYWDFKNLIYKRSAYEQTGL